MKTYNSMKKALETLYYKALLDNPKTAGFKKRSYDTIERVWERIRDDESFMTRKEYESLTKSQKEKMDEFMATGCITAVTLAERNPKVVALRSLMGVYGIGPAKAISLINNGIMTIEQLKHRINEEKLLTKAQKLGVEWYDDLHERIPRKEIDGVRDWLSQNAPSKLRWRIVGSYRRGAVTSGDVDILVTGEGRSQLIKQLKKENIIRHTLASGKTKFMGMAVLPGGTKMRHIDIIETTLQEFPFTSLYFTGSASWNVKMRHQANQKGLRLNEHSYTYVKTGKNVTETEYAKMIGKRWPQTEEDVCAVIDWEFKPPEQR